ncbi:hypothetical protein NMY22_g19935 [Coprinellus aureogranulatus]|nr:hypothetical protein NMY22_g19935 [Coprinellus aureogranulatus]
MAAPASKVRAQTHAASKLANAFSRSKHTAAAAGGASSSSTSSIVEAKLRVREHARHISRTTVSNATAAPATRPTPSFKGATPSGAVRLPGSALNNELEGPNPAPDAALDHTFVGLTGGQIFHEMMLRHGVKHIFGYPGGAILPVFDAIYKSPHFDFVLPRHEQGAGHMAEGYARVSGLPGVVLVTSGPGATNVITPMQDALSDGIPLIVFTGQVALSAIGSDAFQEADVVGISRSCTKWNVMVRDISELPGESTRRSRSPPLADLAPVPRRPPQGHYSWRPQARFAVQGTTPGINLGLPNHFLQANFEPPIDHAQIEQAARMINQAQRPIIYAGGGVLSSPMGPKFLKELAEQGNIPVCTTLQGLGAFDETSDKSLHMLGMHGSAYANIAMQKADVIIALGARFDDRVTLKVDKFAPAARAAAKEGRGGIIHFEIQPKNINKVVEAQIPILGDVVSNLSALVPLVKATPRKEWFESIRGWKEAYPFTYVKSTKGEKMKPQEIVEELDKQCGLRSTTGGSTRGRW